jgi:hypothetical protein
MSEKYTVLDIPAVRHAGIGQYGHVDPATMLDDCRRMYQRQLRDAQVALAELDAGRYTVTQQRGIHHATNERQVWPAT